MTRAILAGLLVAVVGPMTPSLSDVGPHGDSVMAVTDVSVREPDPGDRRRAAFVVRMPQRTEEQRVRVNTENGTARSRTDYRTRRLTLVFAPGETRRRVKVTIRGDRAPEETETFVLTARNLTGTTVNFQGQGHGTIRDDD